MNTPAIAFLDIETVPGTAHVWSLRDEYIPTERLIEPSRVCAVGWLFSNNGVCEYVDVWPCRNEKKRLAMLEQVHDAIVEADAVVTFNGEKFDIPKLQGEMLLAGFPPLPPVAHIDVYKTTRQMGLMSSRLDYVARELGLGGKIRAPFSMWDEYKAGIEAARHAMRRYNLRDVRLLRAVYERVRPFIKDHQYIGERTGLCPACGSNKLQHRGWRRTRVFRHERLHCQSCGHWTTGKRVRV